MALEDVLHQSRDHYQARQARLVAAILMAPPGSPCLRQRGNHNYWYLRTYARGNARREVFLGPEDDPRVGALRERIERRRAALAELSEVKRSLRKLGAKAGELAGHDLRPTLREAWAAWRQQGQGEAGVRLVGQWCYLVLQSCGGVEPWPSPAVELDLAGALPGLGEQPIPETAGEAPEQRENESTGEAIFADRSVFADEAIFADRSVFAGQGPARTPVRSPLPVPAGWAPHAQRGERGSAPGAAGYLGLLWEHGMTIKVHGVGRVIVPSLAAFFLHKLLVAGEHPEAARAEEDLAQAAAAARALAASPEQVRELGAIWDGLPGDWRGKARQREQDLQRLPAEEAQAALRLLGAL